MLHRAWHDVRIEKAPSVGLRKTLGIFHGGIKAVKWPIEETPPGIRPFLLAVKYRVALYVNPVVGFRRDVAAEAVLLVVSRDLLVRCIGFK